MAISHKHNLFNYGDYVPELEADDLIQAVKLKQNLYDEGYAKVQEYYDQMSALPLVRDVDKQYMNNQLNQVFDVIEKNVGSADFSNPDSVRSFIKIAKPLENDPTLKNALESSAEYSTRLKTMQDIKEKHPDKYSAANEWDYLNDLSDWMNGAKPGEKLQSKNYTPYTDNSKHYADMIGKLKADVDVEFQYMSKSGLISKNEIETLKQGRIAELLKANMTPQQLAQMDIDARYHTSSLSNEEKYNRVLQQYTDMRDQSAYMARIKGIENETGISNEQYAMEARANQEIIDGLTNPDGSINRETLDGLHTNLYISDWANGMGKLYQYKQVKSTLAQNPMQMQRVKDAAAMARIKAQGEIQKEIAKIKAENTAKSGKETVPEIFEKSTNAARMADLKSGKIKEISMTGDQYLSNADGPFRLRVEAAAAKYYGLKLKDDGTLDDSNKVTSFKVKRVGNALEYEMEFSNAPGVKRTLDESTLGTQVEEYFNSTTTAPSTTPATTPTNTAAPTPEYESGWSMDAVKEGQDDDNTTLTPEETVLLNGIK